MEIFLKAFTMVFFAEMGDKSQIMAMSFAAKYPLRKVVTGIAIGIAVNHGLAIALGYLLGKMLPMSWISIVAGLLFLYFGWLSFGVGDDDESIEDGPKGVSIIQTIALAFFLGEFGDKTQLTATALASSTTVPLIVFAGTYSAMLATSAFGIALGSLMGQKMPEHLIKFASGSVFLIFGTMKLYEQLPVLGRWQFTIVYASILLSVTLWRLVPLYRDWRSGRQTAMQRAAAHLKQMHAELHQLVEGMCLGNQGDSGCSVCRGTGCIVGQMKQLIAALEHEELEEVTQAVGALEYAVDRNFNVAMAQAGIKLLETFKSTHEEVYSHYDQRIEPIVKRMTELINC